MKLLQNPIARCKLCLILLLFVVNATGQYVSPYDKNGTVRSSADRSAEEARNRESAKYKPASVPSSNNSGSRSSGPLSWQEARDIRLEKERQEKLNARVVYDKVETADGNGLRKVKLNNHWGCIDNFYKVVIPVIYDEIEYVFNKYRLKLNYSYTYVDKYGKEKPKEVVAPKVILSAEDYHDLGIRQYKIFNYTGAIYTFTENINNYPQDETAYHYRGLSKLRLANYTEAITDLTKAIELNPRSDNAYINRGIARQQLKDYAGAVADFNKAIKLDPRSITAYLFRGETKSMLDNNLGAIADFDRCIKLDPAYTNAYIDRGVAKYWLKNYNGTIQDCNQAIKLDPKNGLAYSNRGEARIKLKDKKFACLDFQKALELGYAKADEYLKQFCK